MDYEKIAAAAVPAMTPGDVHRFLVICARVSDLYCSGQDPRQSLEKNSIPAVAAARYKVDAAKIATTVRAELSKAKNKVKNESQSAKKLTTLTA